MRRRMHRISMPTLKAWETCSGIGEMGHALEKRLFGFVPAPGKQVDTAAVLSWVPDSPFPLSGDSGDTTGDWSASSLSDDDLVVLG